MQASFCDALGTLVVNNDGFSVLAKEERGKKKLICAPHFLFLFQNDDGTFGVFVARSLLCLGMRMANQDQEQTRKCQWADPRRRKKLTYCKCHVSVALSMLFDLSPDLDPDLVASLAHRAATHPDRLLVKCFFLPTATVMDERVAGWS